MEHGVAGLETKPFREARPSTSFSAQPLLEPPRENADCLTAFLHPAISFPNTCVSVPGPCVGLHIRPEVWKNFSANYQERFMFVHFAVCFPAGSKRSSERVRNANHYVANSMRLSDSPNNRITKPREHHRLLRLGIITINVAITGLRAFTFVAQRPRYGACPGSLGSGTITSRPLSRIGFAIMKPITVSLFDSSRATPMHRPLNDRRQSH